MTERRAPGENSLRQARSSSVHFGNSLHSHFALINAGRRLANLRAQTPCTRGSTRKRWVQAVLRNASPSNSVAWLNFRMGTTQESWISIFTQTPKNIGDYRMCPMFPEVRSAPRTVRLKEAAGIYITKKIKSKECSLYGRSLLWKNRRWGSSSADA